MKAVKILGIGSYAPETVISNSDIAKIVETSDEWIASRTGIKNRHIVSGNESTLSLAHKAAMKALEFASVKAEDVECIIVATSMPDNLYPSCACELQGALGSKKAIAFDIVAACSGLMYALSIANQYLSSGCYKNALIVGVDVHSRFLDWTDRGTCVLFGDGAGAFYLEADDDISKNEILSLDLNADGSKGKELTIPLSGKNCPLVDPNSQNPSIVYMNGREIYKFAVVEVPKSIKKAIEKANYNIEEIDYLIPHQANMRIITAIADKLSLSMDKVIANLDEYGNTSTASIPLALNEAIDDGRVTPGKILVITGFGAGLTWGASVIKWNAVDHRK
ncbi:MAG: beta-ketoacyl-ACP synthase III [Cyanobacteriota bacterium]